MITYGSTTLTSYNSIVKTEVYYYKSTSATSLSGGSWSTTKPTWENGKYIWQKIRTIYEDGTHSESDPVNITGQQGATGTAAYSYKLYTSDSIIGKTQEGTYTINKVTFSSTSKQGSGAVSAYSGRFKIESTTNGSTWKTEYISSGNESSKEFTIPANIIAIKCSLYQSGGTTVLLDIVTVPVVKDGVNAIGLRDSIPYYLASDKDTGITRLTQGWTRYKPQLTAEKKYLWVYYVSRYSEGNTEPELIEIKDDLVHFENNGDESPVESCVVDIEPVQDLNGYDHPWVGGGGKNLLPCTMTTKTVNGITFTVKEDGTVTANGTASSTVDILLEYGRVTGLSGNYYFTGCPSGGKSGTYDVYPWDITTNARPKKWDGSTSAASDYGAYTLQQIQVLEGHDIKINIRVFKGQTVNNIVFKPMIVKSTETSTAYEPYENICPITGWTKARVTRAGKNLFLPAKTTGYSNSNGVRFDYEADGTITASGTATANAYTTAYDQVGLTFRLPPGRYVKSGTSGNIDGLLVQYIDPADYSHWVTIGSAGSTSFTVTEEQSKCNLVVRVRVASGKTVENEVYKPYIAFESSGSDYEPYVGQTYNITFPTEAGTVYGGTLDVMSGVLTVDRAMVTLNGSSGENWRMSGTGRRFFTDISSIRTLIDAPESDRSYSGAITNKYKEITSVQSWNGGTGAIGFAIEAKNSSTIPGRLTVRIQEAAESSTTVEDFTATLATEPLQICFPLATPVIYQLTPQEITMLCNENNIFTDTGQTSISYYDNQTSTDPFIDYSATSAFEYSTEALDKIDNLKIGGRNLFKKSNDLTQNVWVVENGVRSGDTVTFTIDSSTTGDIRLYQMPASGYWTWEANTDYAMSIDAIADSNGATIYFNAVGLQKTSAHIDITTEWKRYYFIVKGTSATTSSASFFVDNTGAHTVSFRHPKLEKGNKATDWTPAPEDLEDELATMQTDLQTQIDAKIQTYYQSSAPSWSTAERAEHDGDLWYYTGSTTSTYTKGNVYRYNASNNSWVTYSASGELFDKVDGKTTVFYGKTTDTHTSVEKGDYLVDNNDGSSYRYDGSKWVKVTDYQSAIDAVEIGGRNLVVSAPGADWYAVTIEDAQNKNINLFGLNGVHEWLNIPNIPDVKVGDIIQVSFDVKFSSDWKASGTGTARAYVQGNYNGTSGSWRELPYVTSKGGGSIREDSLKAIMDSTSKEGHINTWFKVQADMLDGTYTGITLSNIRFDYYSGIVYVRHVMVEKGTKPTNWSPSPEDVQTSIQAGIDSVQVGARNLLTGTATPISKTTTATSGYVTQSLYYTPNKVTLEQLGFKSGDEITLSFDWEITSATTYGYARIEYYGITSSSSDSFIGTLVNPFTTFSASNTSGHFSTTVALTSATIKTKRLMLRIDNSNLTLIISNLKLERGNKETDWSPAPEDVESSINEAQSTADTAKTSASTANTKIDNLKKPQLAWKVNYSAYGTSNDGECYFHGYNSNNAAADVDGKVDWNGAELTITKGMWINPNTVAPYDTVILHVYRTSTDPHHADVWWDNDLGRWRGYMYKTDKTPNSVADWSWNEETDCILATYVEPNSEGAIQSAQLFNPPKKFSELPDPTVGYGLGVLQDDFDNLEIGGRNLLLDTGTLITFSDLTIGTSNYALKDFYKTITPVPELFVENDTITISFDWSTTATGGSFHVECGKVTPYTWGKVINAINGRSKTSNYVDVTPTNTSGHFIVTFKITNAQISAADTLEWLRIRVDGTDWSGKSFSMSNAKLERGNKATDWTPAPEDVQDTIDNIEVGNRNLLKRTPKAYHATDYRAYELTVTDPLEANQVYSIQLWDVDVFHTGKTAEQLGIDVYYCGSSVIFGKWHGTEYFTNGHADHLTLTFTPTKADIDHSDVKGAVTKFIRLYNSTPSVTGTQNMSVGKWKLEKGNKPTDYSVAPEDIDSSISNAQSTADTALAQSVEYIKGTQTTTTNVWTGVSKDTSLNTGKTIAYYLPYPGNSTAATLNLTFESGGTTGAKKVRWNNTDVTTHYPQYSVITLTYDGTYWRTGAYNSDTINRTRMQNVISAAEAITNGHIICGTASGYRNIGADISFDLSYPLLYASTAIAKGQTDGTRDNNFLEINGINASNNGTITSGAANKTLFLKGKVTGNTFKISASPFMTTVAPTSADGYYYIPLGLMYSATNIYFRSSNRLYGYLDGAFQPLDTASVLRAQNAMNRATATYGTSSTAAGTAEKAVSCSNFVLFNGARIQVTFTNANTTSAPTLNVNSTSAKAIYINKTVTSSSNLLLWTAGSKMEFVYDGTGWIAQNVPYALYGTCSTGASTAAKVVTCNEAVICKGTTISVNMTNTNTTANATMNVGSTLAKDIYANGAKLTTNSRFNWRANTTQKFVFDGQVWRMDDDSVKALATAYITEIDDDGIMVHPEDDSTSGWAISDAIQLFKSGISYIKLWIENNIPKIRIGKEDQGHIILDNDSVDIRNDDKVLASFGATSVIGDENDWHQTIAANQITFAKGDNTITYISPDKLYTINAEVADAFYISNYSIRNASDGKLVIGLRR